jgi:hypothetical protein
LRRRANTKPKRRTKLNTLTKQEAVTIGAVASNDGLDVVAQIRSTHAWNHGPYGPCSDKNFTRSSLPYEAADVIENLVRINIELRLQIEQLTSNARIEATAQHETRARIKT